jgi:hypothetical protein
MPLPQKIGDEFLVGGTTPEHGTQEQANNKTAFSPHLKPQ